MGKQSFSVVQISRVILISTLGLYLTTSYNACSNVSFSAGPQNSAVQLQSTAMIMINNGAPFTNDPNQRVTVNLLNKAAKDVYVTNDSSCESGGQWEPYLRNKPWVLETANSKDTVYARFRNDNLVSACVSASIIHDSINPTMTVSDPAPYTNQAQTSFEIQADDAGSGIQSVSCGTNSNMQDCTMGFTTVPLQEGSHTLNVIASDNAGNNAAPLIKSWIVDLTPPTVVFNSTPPKLTNQGHSVFVVTGSDNLSPLNSYQCTLDNSSPTNCTGTFAVDVGAGSHSISVTVKDAAGNTSAPILYDWVVDLSVPTVIFTATPAPKSNVANPSFSFTDAGPTSGSAVMSYKCQLDSGPKLACTSPSVTGTLAEGQHTFSVWGTNAASTTSAPAVYTWLVDLHPPVLTLNQYPGPRVNQTGANFTFNASDSLAGDVTSMCQLDSQAAAACDQSLSYTGLTEGAHQIQIIAKDGAGNASAPLVFNWIVDLTPPTVSIVSGPPQTTTQVTAAFNISASDPNGGTVTQIQCKLDNANSYGTCTTTPSFSALNPGSHTFYVRAVDSAGNTSGTVTWTWVISATGPTITFLDTPPDPMSVSLPANVEFTVTDPVFSPDKLTVQCGFNGVLKACAANAVMTLDPQTLGLQTFTVTAKNPAGLVSTKTVEWNAKNILQFPSLSSVAAIAFEDNFPNPGDADYNDFVTNFRIVENINDSNQITKINIDFYPRAVGAGYDHSLIVVLDGIKDTPSNITKTTTPMFNGNAQISLITYNANGAIVSTVSNLPKDKDVVIFPSTHALFGNGNLSGTLNSSPGAAFHSARTYARLEIVLSNPASNVVSQTALDISKFRILLHVKNTNQDIDLIDVNSSNFDSNGYPFGFIIPTNWQWPTEGANINNVYPNFPAYRQYLINKKLNPAATAADPVLNWFDYPVTGSTGLYPLPPTPPLLPLN